MGQHHGARRRISRPHVDPMGADLLALFLREPIQAFSVAVVSLPRSTAKICGRVGSLRWSLTSRRADAASSTQFIQPNVGDYTLGIDLSILGQLILDDPVYRLVEIPKRRATSSAVLPISERSTNCSKR